MSWINHTTKLGIYVAAGILSLGNAAAQLPSLNKGPMVGRFAALSTKRFEWGMYQDGSALLRPIDEKGKVMGLKLKIPITISVEETQPDGKIVQRQIDSESLTTKDQPSEKFEKVSFRGKVTGGSEFEIVLEQTRDSVLYGGKLISADPNKNLRLVIGANFPSVYEAAERIDKSFLRSVSGDHVRVTRTDGSRHKAKTNDLIENFQQEVVGAGIREMEVHFDAFRGRDFEFIAHGASKIAIYQRVTAPLNTGFSVQWSPDPAKDPEMAARFEIKVK
jgi:hypothetical protein